MKYLLLLAVVSTSVLVTSCGHTNGAIRGADLSAAADVIGVLINAASVAERYELQGALNSGNSGAREDILDFYRDIYYTLSLANYALELAASYQNEGQAALSAEYKRCGVMLTYTVIEALSKHGLRIPNTAYKLLPPKPENNTACVF